MFKTIITMLAAISLTVTAYAADYKAEKMQFKKEHLSRNYLAASGSQIANYLNEDYLNTDSSCRGNLPAFLCNGVLIRGAQSSGNYYIWEPSSSGLTTGGISFSYLRKDDNYLSFPAAYASGLIIYPDFWAPDGMYDDLDILCSFPLNANSSSRADKGCGMYGNNAKSGPCQAQNIMSASQWLQNGTTNIGQCGFDVSEGSSYDTADGFMQSIKARALLTESQRAGHNEIRIKTWPAGLANTFPVEAFWYINGNTTGLTDAQRNQDGLYKTSTNHRVVPVIRVIPPTTTSGIFQFVYVASEQLHTK